MMRINSKYRLQNDSTDFFFTFSKYKNTHTKRDKVILSHAKLPSLNIFYKFDKIYKNP